MECVITNRPVYKQHINFLNSDLQAIEFFDFFGSSAIFTRTLILFTLP